MQACSPAVITARFGDVATCKVRQAIICEKEIAAPGAGLGGVACAAALPAVTCEAFFSNGLPTVCRPKGTNAIGAPCSSDIQCDSGSCGRTSGSKCGTCKAQAQVNQDCATTRCGQGLTCLWYNGAQKCQMGLAKGAACSTETICAGTLQCIGGTCADALTAGASCTVSASSFFGGCDAIRGLQCVTGTCTATNLGATGASCGTSVLSGCAGGTCQGPSGSGMCVPRVADGAACIAGGAACQVGASCVSGTCTVDDPSACK